MESKELKILFSEQNSQQQAGLKRFFDGKGVKTCFCPKDGKEVLKIMEQWHPDVVVLDVFLTSVDAIEVHRQSNGKSWAPKVYFAGGSMDSEKLAMQLINEGYDYYFVKPYSCELLLEMAQRVSGVTVGKKHFDIDIEERVSEILHTMGVPAHIKGYGFLRQSIIMTINEPEVISLVTKRLYPEIAKMNNTTASRVERAIRHAIEIAWDRGNVEVMNDYFGYTVNNMRGKPTNSEFIAMISDRLRLALKRNKIS